ncbi:LysR family transcriptional regulator [Serratia sp. T13T92]|uniref:LysR family transcriptional regulator n=1 Tax=Serratia sp. T13T92 TaxID=3397496 RepID=UPI0039E0775D
MDSIDIKHMRIFLLLVREKNVSKVAHTVGMSQQAISAYLKRLRSFFPSELFLRKSAGLEATDYAIELAEKFEKIIDDVDNLLLQRPFYPHDSKIQLSIIANEYAQLIIIPELLREIHKEAPKISINVKDFNFKTHVETLASGDADLVIGFADHIDAGLVRKKLMRENYCCVVRHDSEIPNLIANSKPITSFPAVEFSFSTINIGDIFSKFFEGNGSKNSVIATLPFYSTLSAFMSFNDVIAFIPSAIGARGDFRELRLRGDVIQFDVSAAWHRKSTGNPQRKWLTDKLFKLIGN